MPRNHPTLLLLLLGAVGFLVIPESGCKSSVRQLKGVSLAGEKTEPLLAISLEPTPGRTEVGPRSVVRVGFSEAVDPASLGSEPLSVTDLFTARPLTGTTVLDLDQRTLVFRATAGFPGISMFSVDASPALRSAKGGAFTANPEPNTPRFPAFYSTFLEPPVLRGVLSFVDASTSSVSLGWGAASDNSSPDGSGITYKIHVARSSEAIDYSRPPERETAEGALSDTVMRLDAGTAYRFAIQASDSLGNLSLPSNEVIASTRSTTDGEPPEFAGIERLEVNLASPTTLKAVWSPGRDRPDPLAPLLYNVYLATESGKQDFSVPAIISAPGATEVIIKGLLPDTEYFVIVRAMDAEGNEEMNTVEAPTPRRTPVSFSENVLRMMTLPAGYDPSLCWPVCTNFRQPGGCARGGCHSGTFPAGGLGLLTYEDYRDSSTIVPGNPGGSEFIFRLRTTGGRRMPQNGRCNLLDDCIQVVERWILQGALEN